MRDMEPVRRGVNKIVLEMLNGAPAQERPMIAWPLACGPTVAGKTRAVGFTDGVLTVEVPSTDWRTQLREMSGQYLGTLRQLAGQAVQRIEFVLPQPASTRGNSQ